MNDALEPSSAPSIGSRLDDRFELRRFLGAGGVGAVYEAVDLDRARFAIKVLLDPLQDDATARARFVREAKVSASLDSQHVVPVIDAAVDAHRATPYLVMPLLCGFDLARLIKNQAPLRPSLAVRIACQIARGLEGAHDAGVVHRDVKPSNVFLDHGVDGTVTARLLDFGLARHVHELGANSPRLTDTGLILGSPRYMAPEQMLDAKRADHRADLYGLAATLYYALAGRPPYHEATSLDQLIVAATRGELTPLSEHAPWMEPELARTVHAALNPDPDGRCPSAARFIEELRAFSEGTLALSAAMIENAARALEDTVELSASGLVDDETEEDDPPTWLDGTRPDSLLGVVVADRYTLLRRLGSGGMGTVYEARSADGDRFALKVIGGELGPGQSRARKRLLREARLAMQIRSDHVVQVYEAGTDDEHQLTFIVMELLQGEDLETLLERIGPLAEASVRPLFAQACHGIEAAHQLNLVHRDIKPANLFLHELPSGKVQLKVCDFGLAKPIRTEDERVRATKLTRTGRVIGSPVYMSPEQTRAAKTIDERSDVWSLGISLYQALSGTTPWDHHETVGEIIVAICTEDLPHLQDRAPWVSTKAAEAVHTALARKPDERFSTMAAFRAALGGDDPTEQPLSRSALNAVPAATRGRVAERAAPADSQTMSVTTRVVARTLSVDTDAPAASSRRWRPLGVGMGLAVAATAGLLLVSRMSSVADGSPSESAALVESAAAEATEPSAVDEEREYAVRVAIEPSSATVHVDEIEVELEDGFLNLQGEAGQRFGLVLRHERQSVRREVVITRDGRASPERISLGDGDDSRRRTADPRRPTRGLADPGPGAPAAPDETTAGAGPAAANTSPTGHGSSPSAASATPKADEKWR